MNSNLSQETVILITITILNESEQNTSWPLLTFLDYDCGRFSLLMISLVLCLEGSLQNVLKLNVFENYQLKLKLLKNLAVILF